MPAVSANSDTSEQSSFSDKHDIDSDDDKDEINYLEAVQYENVKSGMCVLVFYEKKKWHSVLQGISPHPLKY